MCRLFESGPGHFIEITGSDIVIGISADPDRRRGRECLSNGAGRKGENLKRLIVRPARRDVKLGILAQDHDGAPVGFRIVDPRSAVLEESLEAGEVDRGGVVLENLAEKVESRTESPVFLQGHLPALQRLRESRIEIVVDQRMVRMVGEFGALERDESGHFAGRTLEGGGIGWSADDVVLRRRGLDVLKKLHRLLVGFLAQNSPDDEGDGEPFRGIGELGNGVDADRDRPAIQSVGSDDSRDRKDEGFQILPLVSYAKDRLKTMIEGWDIQCLGDISRVSVPFSGGYGRALGEA